mmetsp:Transcript_10972/g.23431  ORF Transcript_10972/g.23431 Transcript_10972/m.23431 type:complete len:276 (+) Transcript_10972:370-1197(+)
MRKKDLLADATAARRTVCLHPRNWWRTGFAFFPTRTTGSETADEQTARWPVRSRSDHRREFAPDPLSNAVVDVPQLRDRHARVRQRLHVRRRTKLWLGPHVAAALSLRRPDLPPPAKVRLHLRPTLWRLRVGHLRPLSVTDAAVNETAVSGHQCQRLRPPAVPSQARVEHVLADAAPVGQVGVELDLDELGLGQQRRGRVRREEEPLTMRFVYDEEICIRTAHSLLNGQRRIEILKSVLGIPRVVSRVTVDNYRVQFRCLENQSLETGNVIFNLC